MSTNLAYIDIVSLIAALAASLLLPGCDAFTDAATRLAYDLESAAGQLEGDGDRVKLYHETPSRKGECDGPYTVQVDKAGALIIWCKDDNGAILSSPGTSYHRRFVETPETYYREKAAGETLVIELERRSDRAVIVDVN